MIIASILTLAPLFTASAVSDEFLNEFMKKRAAIQVVTGSFNQRSTVGEDVEETPGTVLFAAPHRIRLHTTTPDLTVMLDNKRVFEYEPGIQQLRIFDLDDSPESAIFFLSFNNDLNELDKAYDITLEENVESPQGSRAMHLRPKTSDPDQAFFKSVAVYIRDDTFLPWRVIIQHDDESKVELEFTEYTLNPALDVKDTQMEIAEGTRVIDNDVVTIDAVPAGGLRMPEPAGTPETGTGANPAPEAPAIVERPLEAPAKAPGE
ncbi:MAG: outer membrane lipoprotein carrier protein LolA [Candidatus Hydrogenedentes bacterium]|nr:outer membrane lipoprotein carrier protein LolA [Candidatus Hydrogenedentota bacterium]